MTGREMMRESVKEFERYYNPVIEQGVLRMDTNTNVLGSNPQAEKYLKTTSQKLNEYPSTYSNGLRDQLADFYGLERDNFVAGNGSDEMLNTIFATFCEPGKTVCTIPCPSYSLYTYFVQLAGGKLRESELDQSFQLNVEDIVGKGEEKKGIILMPSPNNPTGNMFCQKDIEEIISKFEGIVILDEAYAEYANFSLAPRVEEFDNLIVTKTFSKAYAMANLRVGYAVQNKKIADMLNAVKVPYSLNGISEGAAMAALKDQNFIKKSVETVQNQRPKLSSKLKELGFEPYPSDANFILAKSPIDHMKIIEGMKKKKVLIRDFGKKYRTENCVRMTVGTEELNKIMTDAMEEVLSEEKR